MNKVIELERRTQQRQAKVQSLQTEAAHRKMAMEVAIKILINGVLSTAAIAALVKLLPYYFSGEAKLKEIRLEVYNTETRVNKLRENFSSNFAPTLSDSSKQNYSSKIEPQSVRVFLQAPTEKK